MQVILTASPVAARLGWQVQRLEWRATGGAHRAWLQVDLPQNLRWLGAELCSGLLGQPLTVIDVDGAPCWWGYAHAVTWNDGELAQRLALDGLFNCVACLYLRPDGEWAQTAWAEDVASISFWGRRERLLECSGGEAEALAARDALLAQAAQPRWTAAVQPAESAPSLAIEAHGWWERLDWSHYTPEGGRAEVAFSGGAGQPVGAQTANTRVAQSFRLAGQSWPVGEVWLKVGKRGSPADSLRLELCADASGNPGALLASAEVSATALAHATAWLRFALDNPLLVADTPYWLVLRRTGALDAENYYTTLADEEIGYPDGECRLWDGANWRLRQPPADLNFRVNGSQPAAELIAALVAGTPLFHGVRLDDASSLVALRWRNGRRTCLAELADVLAAAKMLAEVEADRRISVRRIPPEGEIEAYLRGGAIATCTGVAWQASRPLAGRWLKAGEAAVWAERVAWEDGILKVE